jgi:predicted O-methyltransferase YrrM
LKLVPKIAVGFVQRKSFSESVPPEATKDCYIPVSREQGEFLYLTARVIGATNVVEFGTSFGISTIYLAAAVRDNDGAGIVIGSEIDPPKCAQASRNLEEAGLGDHADVREGDALETLRDVPEAVDLVLLDGAKDLYLPVIELLIPKLRPGAVVVADNIHTFRKGLKPYVDFMQSGDAGFVSTTLSLGQGFEYSTYLG